MPIGAKILDAIDEAIRLRDKVLLILSEDAIASDWVEGEVTRALDEERERKRLVLFPIRVDDAVLETKEAWARLLRGQRNIGDFTRWKDHDAYQKALERVLRDLKVEDALRRVDAQGGEGRVARPLFCIDAHQCRTLSTFINAGVSPKHPRVTPGRSRPGPTCQRGSSSAATTGSCLLRSCAVSSRTGSALRLTRSMPGIALR